MLQNDQEHLKQKVSDRCYSWYEEEGRAFIRCERNIQRHVLALFQL